MIHRDLRRDQEGIARAFVIIGILLVVVVVILALYAMGFFTPPEGKECPPTERMSGECKFWLRVDITGTVVANVGAPPSLASGSLKMTVSLSTQPASLMKPPQLILDETSTIGGKLSVTYPSGTTYTYDLPSYSGVNTYNFDIVYWIQGPSGQYTFTAKLQLQQTGCWLGCAPPATYTVTTTFVA